MKQGSGTIYIENQCHQGKVITIFLAILKKKWCFNQKKKMVLLPEKKKCFGQKKKKKKKNGATGLKLWHAETMQII